MERGKYAPRKKRVVCSAAWSQGISKRLKELGISQTELAARCAVVDGSITAWIYGNVHGQPVEPSAENLIRLSNELDTTSDYLLGLTTSPTRNNPDLRNACDFTGLSVEAVKQLSGWCSGSRGYQCIVSQIIAHNDFSNLVNSIIRRVKIEKKFAYWIEAIKTNSVDELRYEGDMHPQTLIAAARCDSEEVAREIITDVVQNELKKPPDEIDKYLQCF